MKRIITIAFALVALLVMFCSADQTPQQRYIDRFASLAVSEMYRSGVPASITLAQGLLESNSGQSYLATEGNNHFGIKCHSDWKGKTIHADDDQLNECFRKYDDVLDSYADHSDHLRYSPRYHFLFDYPITDYRSWAYGLSKAGYATDRQYPSKLVTLIENYSLAKYDKMKPSDFDSSSHLFPSSKSARGGQNISEGNAPQSEEEMLPSGKKSQKRVKVKKVRKAAKNTSRSDLIIEEAIPESPNALAEPRAAVSEQFVVALDRRTYLQNGVPFVYSIEGDSYRILAERNNLFYREILKFNDLTADETLAPGTIVYLQAKKNYARKGLDKYIVEKDGESLRDICQQYGVKMSSINHLNGFSSTHRLREGDTILLRK